MRAVPGRSLEGASCANRRFGVSDALGDQIVQALMAADRIDPSSVAALMRRMAVRLHLRATACAANSPRPSKT